MSKRISLFIVCCLLLLSSSATLAQGKAKDFNFTGWSLQEASTKDIIGATVTDYGTKNGINITTAGYPYNEYLNQIVLKAKSGELKGAVQLDIAWLTPLASMGVLRDLSAQAKDAGYTDPALLSGQFKGKQYGLPWTTASIGMVANKELLEAAGVKTIPTTIDEFEAALAALKKYNPDIIPYAAMTDSAQLKDIIPWIWTFGGQVVDDKGNIVLDDAGTVAAVDWYAKLLKNGYTRAKMTRFDARQLFAQGKVGFYDDAIAAGALAAKGKPADLKLTVVPMYRPVLKAGDKPQALLWGHIVVVMEGDQADSAADFARFITSDKATALNYFVKASLPPTTTAALASDEVTKSSYFSTWGTLITATAKPNPFWPYAQSAQMEKTLGDRVQDVLLGNASAKDAMAQAKADIEDMVSD